jgi:hypothetical protein
LGVKRGWAAGAAILLALLAAGCGTHDDPPTLGERLRGNWKCHHVYPDQGFLRTDDATMAVYQRTIQYTDIAKWECDSVGPCPGDPPNALGGYFEGIFQDLGDSLVLQDATDTVSFKDVTDDSFTFVADGIAFPMQRN